MSRSPISSDASEQQVTDYRNGWSALSLLIGQGRSFSGHERNCCFLNTGGSRFADVSAAACLDFEDDSRAVAMVDWDLDGRVDIWTTNRTAPRIRLLRNDTRADAHYLAIRLEGVTCNRDSIGARVELYLKGETDQKRIQTLHAGDGYLSQSSKWIHFGLGRNKEIDRLVVKWPGGSAEIFSGLIADHRYEIRQGSGKAVSWIAPRSLEKMTVIPIEIPPEEPTMRTVIVDRLPFPEVQYEDSQGNEVHVDKHQVEALLINLWSSSCRPCLVEMAEWTTNRSKIREAGLEVLALCVDSLDPSIDQPRKKAQRLIDSMSFPFNSGYATQDLVRTLETIQRMYLELQQPLPVPCSFLLDKRGRVSVIYKGVTSFETLLSDVKLLNASADQRRDSAIPFSGKWTSYPFVSDPRSLISNFVNLDEIQKAVSYARRYLLDIENPANHVTDPNGKILQINADVRRILGGLLFHQGMIAEAKEVFRKIPQTGTGDQKIHRQIGELYLTRNFSKDAVYHLQLALRDEPDDPRLLFNVALAEVGAGKLLEAVDHFQVALRLQPQNAATHFHLANTLHALDRSSKALTHYRKALELRPGWVFPANNLAWILATHHDAKLRNGLDSLELAQEICRTDEYKVPSTLSTLAAAHAELGQFEDALRINEKAIDLVNNSGQKNLVKKLLERKKLYQQKRPLRDPEKQVRERP